MLDGDGPSNSQRASTFPVRFAAALEEARGAMSGIAASASRDRALIPPEALRRFQEVYKIKIELELETAGFLWRTSEVVRELAEAIDVLHRRAPRMPPPPYGLDRLARRVAGEPDPPRALPLTPSADALAETPRARWPEAA